MSLGVCWKQEALNHGFGVVLPCVVAVAWTQVQVGEWAAASSLDVTVVVSAVGLGHVHLAHGVAHMVDSILAGRHALVDAVQTFSLCEAVDLVLWREAADGCGETGKAHNEQLDSCFSSASRNYICK